MPAPRPLARSAPAVAALALLATGAVVLTHAGDLSAGSPTAADATTSSLVLTISADTGAWNERDGRVVLTLPGDADAALTPSVGEDRMATGVAPEELDAAWSALGEGARQGALVSLSGGSEAVAAVALDVAPQRRGEKWVLTGRRLGAARGIPALVAAGREGADAAGAMPGALAAPALVVVATAATPPEPPSF